MKFIRIFDINLLPKYLVEQVKDLDSERFYSVFENLVNFSNDFIELIVNEQNIIIGFVWYVVDLIDFSLHVNTVSLRKDYQGNGKVLKIFIEKLRNDIKGTKLKKITWCTDRPAFYERMGFKRSNQVLLEHIL